MIDLSDLGLAPATSAATATTTTTTVLSNDRRGKALVPGSIVARVVYAAFAGEPVTIVDSPPGAGKTTSIVDVLDTLLRRSALEIVVATPTKRGAADLAGRLAAELGETGTDGPAVVLSVKDFPPPVGVQSKPPTDGRRHLTVRTIASCAHGAPKCDVLFIDEAYQATYADVMAAADEASQVVMVGDPGQIGPVITQDTSAWDDMLAAPHHRAPEVFARRDDATVLRLDATYRLGQTTVDAIAPLYGFSFASKRPDRHLTRADGTRLPEIDSIQIPASSDVQDLGTLRALADLAVSKIGSMVHSLDTLDAAAPQVIEARDVAVVVSRSVQASSLQAILRARGHEGITVGTADKMQGGQWHAVVAMDPLVGQDSIGPHQVNAGRLCVMASRHQTHLTWVHDGTAIDRLTAAAEEYPEAKVGLAVRRHLTATTAEPLAGPLAGPTAA